jgi:hypothetical protein
LQQTHETITSQGDLEDLSDISDLEISRTPRGSILSQLPKGDQNEKTIELQGLPANCFNLSVESDETYERPSDLAIISV